MLTFEIQGQSVSVEQIYHIDSRFLVCDHPDTGKPILLIRDDCPTPTMALRRLGMHVMGLSKLYKGIKYYDVEVNSESEGA